MIRLALERIIVLFCQKLVMLQLQDYKLAAKIHDQIKKIKAGEDILVKEKNKDPDIQVLSLPCCWGGVCAAFQLFLKKQINFFRYQ